MTAPDREELRAEWARGLAPTDAPDSRWPRLGLDERVDPIVAQAEVAHGPLVAALRFGTHEKKSTHAESARTARPQPPRWNALTREHKVRQRTDHGIRLFHPRLPHPTFGPESLSARSMTR